VGFLDPSFEDPNSCTILLPSPNSNGCPSIDLGLLDCTYIFSGLNTAEGGSIPILSLCNSLACGPPCVCCCCFFIANYVDFRCCPSNLHICFPSFSCSSTFGNLVSLSLLIFCLQFFIYASCGDEIYGASTLYLLAYTNVGIVDGATLPLIIF